MEAAPPRKEPAPGGEQAPSNQVDEHDQGECRLALEEAVERRQNEPHPEHDPEDDGPGDECYRGTVAANGAAGYRQVACEVLLDGQQQHGEDEEDRGPQHSDGGEAVRSQRAPGDHLERITLTALNAVARTIAAVPDRRMRDGAADSGGVGFMRSERYRRNPRAGNLSPQMSKPPVTIILPVYNEAGTIDTTLESLLGQDYDGSLDVIVADGGSEDGTRDRLDAWAASTPNMTVIHNDRRVQSYGLNAAAEASAAPLVVRLPTATPNTRGTTSADRSRRSSRPGRPLAAA